MIYKIAAYSDIGIVKKTNQDSVLMKVAQTNHGRLSGKAWFAWEVWQTENWQVLP